MNVGWIARQPLPQFVQKLTFACGAISDADAANDLAQAKLFTPATAIASGGEICFHDVGARHISPGMVTIADIATALAKTREHCLPRA